MAEKLDEKKLEETNNVPEEKQEEYKETVKVSPVCFVKKFNM